MFQGHALKSSLSDSFQKLQICQNKTGKLTGPTTRPDIRPMFSGHLVYGCFWHRRLVFIMTLCAQKPHPLNGGYPPNIQRIFSEKNPHIFVPSTNQVASLLQPL